MHGSTYRAAAVALGLAAGLAACSSLLGDFDLGPIDDAGSVPEGGAGLDGQLPAEATAPPHDGGDAATTPAPDGPDGHDAMVGAGDATVGAGDAANDATGTDARDDSATGMDSGAPADAGADATPDSGAPTCGPLDGGDPANCGACGHSCQGGTCAASMCQPFSMSGATTQPVSLAANDGKVFWQQAGGTVFTEPTSGATSGTTLYAGSNPATCPSPTACQTNIVIDTTTAYWPDFIATEGPVVQAQVFGGNSAFRYGSEANSNGRYSFLVQDGTDIFAAYYFVTTQGGGCPNAGVDYMPIQPRSTTVTTWMLPSFCRINQMAIDATNLYWTDLGAPNGQLAPGVFVAPKRGTTSMLIEAASTPVGIAAYQGTVYWTDSGSGLVRSWIAGGSPMTVSSSTAPGPLTVDSTGVYWIDSGATIMHVPLVSGVSTAQPLATGQTGAAAIATNTTSVFWIRAGTAAVTYADGAVMKLAK